MIYPQSLARPAIVFDGPDPAYEARLERMRLAVEAFADLNPQEQQAQIATWPAQEQPEALKKAA
jgi:hypothetical protein